MEAGRNGGMGTRGSNSGSRRDSAPVRFEDMSGEHATHRLLGVGEHLVLEQRVHEPHRVGRDSSVHVGREFDKSGLETTRKVLQTFELCASRVRN